MTLERLACLVRFHRPAQFAHRFAQLLRRRFLARREGRRYELRPGGPRPVLRENEGFRAILAHRLAQRAADASERAKAVHAGRFRFLNAERELASPIDWRLTGVDAPALWRFHLHYQEYLLGLAAAVQAGDAARHYARAWELAASWIDGNSPADRRTWGDGWHPYCIARRLPAWMLLWTAQPPGGDLADRVLQSMFLQSRFLARHLEYDLGGNHLLEDLRALAMAGAFFAGEEADGWLDQSERLLTRELRQQILPHGEHFERSPMYHCQMLDALLDVRDVTQTVRPALSAACGETAARMAGFLQSILHPDGQIPLLADSALDEAGEPKQLIRRAGFSSKELGCGPLRVGDYWRFADGGDWLLLDAGPVGADHLPAHAHADLLTLEASIDGKRLLVDGGVFNYEDDAMRAYCRGTAAHNTLMIDGLDQCDVYSRFRMGRRGWPTGFRYGETGGFGWALAAHDAYRSTGVPRVERFVACRGQGPWICIDRALGHGRHTLASWLHIHPDWRVEPVAEGEVRLTLGETRLRLRALGPCTMTVGEGWYCPEFGVRMENAAIRFDCEAALPAACGWTLDHEGSTATVEWQETAGAAVVISVHDGATGRAVRLAPLEM